MVIWWPTESKTGIYRNGGGVVKRCDCQNLDGLYLESL
jgi:hypothetical protein